VYFVLLGAISPAEGRGPNDLKIYELRDRILAEQIKEVVIATDPDTEGEMTALHITNELRPLGIKISRIGLGIPMGSSVEYADLSTLTMSMSTRREL
jgi:recombination protein RecR